VDIYEQSTKIKCMESNQPLLDLIANEMNTIFQQFEWAINFKIFDEVMLSFETYGFFINDIPKGNYKLDAFEAIANWIYCYYIANAVMGDMYGTYYPKVDASKKIQKMTRTIEKFEDLIIEHFGEELESIEKYGDNYHFEKEYGDELDQISQTLKHAKRLKHDLQEKEFRIFTKNRFYKREKTPKQDLKRILKYLKHAVGLTVSDSEINDLINKLPNTPTPTHIRNS